MEKTKLSNKGQIVIPKKVRAVHGWEPGLEFVLGCIHYKGPKKTLKEMEAAIAKGAREKI